MVTGKVAVKTPIMIASSALVACSLGPARAQPLPVSEREVLAYSLPTSAPETGAAGEPLLRKAAVDGRTREIPVEAFPEELRARLPQADIHTEMVVSLDAQGKPRACRPTVLFSWADRNRMDEPLDGAVGAELCALATERLAYHPALADDGTRVAADVVVAILFRQEMMAPPAPMPPASIVVSKGGFPPPYFWAAGYRGVSFSVPRGKDFAPTERREQRNATVGLLLSGDATGAITDCKVAGSSGYPLYDAASCAAARTIRVSYGERTFALQDFPLRMVWHKRVIELQTPVASRGPQLVAEPEVRVDLPAGMQLAKWAETSVELTVTPQGRLQDCTLTGPSYNDTLDIASCKLFGPDTRFTPPVGIFGDPAEGLMRLRIDWNARTIRRNGY